MYGTDEDMESLGHYLIAAFSLYLFPSHRIYDDNTAYKLTLTALEVGYRNFFASVLAGNQKGFAKAIRDSNVPREDM